MKAQSNATLVGRSLFATILGMFVAPALWALFMPLFGGSDAVLYAMASAIVLCTTAYVGTLFLLRRWSR